MNNEKLKVFGPFNFKQFTILVGVAGLIYILNEFLDPQIAIPVSLALGVIGIIFARREK